MVSRARESSPAADHVRGCRSERVGNLFHLWGLGDGFVGGADCPVLASTFSKPPASPLSSRERSCIRQQIDGGFREQRLTGQTTKILSTTATAPTSVYFLQSMFMLRSVSDCVCLALSHNLCLIAADARVGNQCQLRQLHAGLLIIAAQSRE